MNSKKNSCGHKCGVPGCENNNLLSSHLSFFRFPRKEEQRRYLKWCGNIGVKESEVSPHQRLCQIHFQDKYFCSKQKIRLKLNAIPTLNLPDRNRVPIRKTNKGRTRTKTKTVKPKVKERRKVPHSILPKTQGDDSSHDRNKYLLFRSGVFNSSAPGSISQAFLPPPPALISITMGTDVRPQEKRVVSHFKQKCFYKFCISRRKSYVSPEPYPYLWTAPKSTDHLEWINFIRKLPPDYVEVEQLANRHRFCHLHFEERFIVKANKYNVDGKTYEVALSKWRLTPDAYPTLFDPQDQSRELQSQPQQSESGSVSVIKSVESLCSDELQNRSRNHNQKAKDSLATHVTSEDSLNATVVTGKEIEAGSGSRDHVPGLNDNISLSPPQVAVVYDESLLSIPEPEPEVVEITTVHAATKCKGGKAGDFERVTNIGESSSSSLSLHDMVDIEIPSTADCDLSLPLHSEDCDENVSRVLHTPPGDPDEFEPEPEQEPEPEPGSYMYVNSNSDSGAIAVDNLSIGVGSCVTLENQNNLLDHDPESETQSRSPDVGGSEEQYFGDDNLNDSSGGIDEILIIDSSVVQNDKHEIASASNSTASFIAPNQKRKRKQELSNYGIGVEHKKVKESKSKDRDDVEVIDLDSSSDSSEDQAPSFTPSTAKLQPSILKRTIAKITNGLNPQHLQTKADVPYHSNTSFGTSPSSFPFKVINSSSLLSGHSGPLPLRKLLPGSVPNVANLNPQFIVLRQSVPTAVSFVSSQSHSQNHNENNNRIQSQQVKTAGQAQGQGHPIVILGPQPTPFSSVTGDPTSVVQQQTVSVNANGNPSAKLIILKQSPASGSGREHNLNVNNSSSNSVNSNGKNCLASLTARDLSLLLMPSPDWSVNTYPDLFSISETIMSQDNMEIIRKSITMSSNNWLMKFSVFAQDVPHFSSGRLAGAGGIGEVQQVLNRFAEVTICSGIDLDSRSSQRRYSESSITYGRKALMYAVDHNYRSKECPLVILKNSTHPLDTDNDTCSEISCKISTNEQVRSGIRKKAYEFVLCSACTSVQTRLEGKGKLSS